MSFYERGDVRIHYQELGSGYPVLLFAPGLMRSSHEIWLRQDLKPHELLPDSFRVISMDQRNAGASTAPIKATDSWVDYARDAVGLIDHLGLERLHVWGRCIGPSFAMKVLEQLGDRASMITAFIDHAPIGLNATNRGHFMHGFYEWAEELPQGTFPGPASFDPTAASLCENLFGGEFVFSVSRDFVRTIKTPMLILPGRDLAHPEETAMETARLVPHAQVRERWYDDLPAAGQAVKDFLKANTPA
jgi:pimeloyl-ACP methyl ester carboxylesterase